MLLDTSDVFLSKLGVARENVDDTAGAAQYVATSGLRDAGVIASARAAEIYGLNILATKIQDDPDFLTRFLVLARDPIIPRTDKPFKTSIVFALDEGPGVLFKALAVFALRDISLTKIESRPQRKRPLRLVDDSNNGSAKYFDYLFFIDFEASMAEPRAQSALGHLQGFGQASIAFYIQRSLTSLCLATCRTQQVAGICNISSCAWLLSNRYNFVAVVSFASSPLYIFHRVNQKRSIGGLMPNQRIYCFKPLEFWGSEG
ncbi:hypothetical protein Patl1_02004 [Pistacia atlantica]|uniref:Uncharacterized protein n=1 Tax=Pistacia atlantica TaxID=434234 RepID=A0ACC1CAF8_9ROSI|nr:hypothetical protein Patl1_02004 [Pistacia atlantica]